MTLANVARLSLTSLTLMTWYAPGAAADAAREAEIFGNAARPAAPAVAPTPSPVQGLVDQMQVGGRLEVGLRTQQREQQNIKEAPLSSYKQADVYFDARPHEHLRSFLRARLSAGALPSFSGEPTASAGDNVRQEIDELWFKWDYDRSLFFTVGRQHLKWGSGRVWNPSDFMAAETRDPFALFDRRLGQELLKVHLPLEKGGQNFYGVLQYGSSQRNDDLGVGLRGEFPFAGIGELALSAASARQQPLRFGVDLSTALGPIDILLEGVASKKHRRQFYRGSLDPDLGILPEAYGRDDEWLKQLVAGMYKVFKYHDDDTVTLGMEFFYNELGYAERDLELYALAMGDSQPLYAGERYLAVYGQLPTPGSWNHTSFYMHAIGNLSDRTVNLRLTQTWELHRNARIELFASRCFGDYGELCFRVSDKLATLARSSQFGERLSVPQQTRLAALPEQRTIVTAGLGMSMDF